MLDSIRGRVSISGACAGPVIGLVAITPACGFVQPGWAIFIGMATVGIVYGLLLVKKYLHYDVHGCGMIDIVIDLQDKLI